MAQLKTELADPVARLVEATLPRPGRVARRRRLKRGLA